MAGKKITAVSPTNPPILRLHLWAFGLLLASFCVGGDRKLNVISIRSVSFLLKKVALASASTFSELVVRTPSGGENYRRNVVGGRRVAGIPETNVPMSVAVPCTEGT